MAEAKHYDLIPERFHARVRKICMKLPDAVERPFGGR